MSELNNYKVIIPLDANGTSSIENYKSLVNESTSYKTLLYREGE